MEVGGGGGGGGVVTGPNLFIGIAFVIWISRVPDQNGVSEA